MEEAEALCERVGIFVNGEMKSLGTPARLKANFGENFKVLMINDIVIIRFEKSNDFYS